MSLLEELRLWQHKAQELQAQVRKLTAENQALKKLIGTDQAVPPGKHGREDVARNHHPDRNQTRGASEPTQRDACVAGSDRGRENFLENPSPLSSQPLRQSSFPTFVIEVPQSQPRPVTLPVDRFLATGLEANKNWQERRQDLGLSEPRWVIQTFFQLVTRTAFSIMPPSEIRDETPNSEALLQLYQNFVQNLCENKGRLQQITDFAILLLVSLCRVAAIAKEMPVETIDQYMNTLMPPNRKSIKGAPYLRRLRTAVLWPVRQAAGLRPWLGNRADEFFLLCKPCRKRYPVELANSI